MAKYTLLYKDFKDAGGQLPASFATLAALFINSDFAAAFEARYAYREIGGETLEVFENRIDAKAKEIYPRFKLELERAANVVQGRTRTETTEQDLTNTLNGTFDKGAVNRITRNLAHSPITTPLNNEDVVDGATSDETSAQDVNHSEQTNKGRITRTYEEQGIDLAAAEADYADRYKYLFEDALKAFNVCFLEVW